MSCEVAALPFQAYANYRTCSIEFALSAKDHGACINWGKLGASFLYQEQWKSQKCYFTPKTLVSNADIQIQIRLRFNLAISIL